MVGDLHTGLASELENDLIICSPMISLIYMAQFKDSDTLNILLLSEAQLNLILLLT